MHDVLTASSTPPAARLRQGFARPLLCGALAAAAAVSSAPALAASDIFLTLEGIKGESVDAKLKDSMEITAYSQSFQREDVARGAGGGGASVSKASCGDIRVTKVIDKASPQLMLYVMTGKTISKGSVVFRASGSKSLANYYTVALEDVLIEAVSQSDGAGDGAKVMESVAIRAGKFHFSYFPQNADGSLGAEVKFGYDCVANRPL